MASSLLFLTAAVGLLAVSAQAFDQAAATAFLKSSTNTEENTRLLRLEALAETDSAFAAGQAAELGELTGSRLETLSRKLLIKKSLGLNYASELFLIDQWYTDRQGFDSLFRTNHRDLAHYCLSMARLGRKVDPALDLLVQGQRADGSWSEKAGRSGSPGLTALSTLALRASGSSSAFAAPARKGIQWLSSGFSARLTAERADLLFLLRSARVIQADEAYRGAFESLWNHVGKQQGADGSIQGDVELTALASLVASRLPGNLQVESMTLVDGQGRPRTETLTGQPLRVSLRLGARLADHAGNVRVQAELQANSTASPLQLDTVVALSLVKGGAADILLELDTAGPAGTYRLAGAYTYASAGDSVETRLDPFYIRVAAPSDLRFTGDSLRVLPDSAYPGDTVAIRVRFMNTGSSLAEPFQVLCLVRPVGGAFDTLGLQSFARANRGVPMDFTFLSAFPAGDYEARIILDAGDDVVEADEGDNLLDVPFSVVSLPDLAFKESFDISCQPAGDSAQCSLQSILLNKGGSASDSFSFQVAMVTGRLSSVLLDSALAGLGADSELSVSLEISLPESLALANTSYRVVMTLDPAAELEERNEDNNRAEKPLLFSVGENLNLTESTEEPPPVFIVPGTPLREFFNVRGQNLADTTEVEVRISVLRDSLDTLQRLDTALTLTPGNSSRPLAFTWTPIDSAYRYDIKVQLDPANAVAETLETDNALSIRRFVTGFQSRLLAGTVRMDTAGQLKLKVLAKDLLGRPISGLDKASFSVSRGDVQAQSFDVAELTNLESTRNQVDVVIMDTHNPAALYRTRKLYYEFLPELQHEFARSGFSLHFKFQTPYFYGNASPAIVHGDFAQGIFNGEIRNLLDEPDNTYKWAPAATYLAAHYPWRTNALKVMVPMFDLLGEGEEINQQDPNIPNVDDSSDYHLEFADTCVNRNIHPMLLVGRWGYSELMDGQVKAVVSKTGGERNFAGTRESMKSELRRFIIERLANYLIQGDVRDLGLSLTEEDWIHVRMEHQKGISRDSTRVEFQEKPALDLEVRLANAVTRNDTLAADILFRNHAGFEIQDVGLEIRRVEGGSTVSRFVLPQGRLPGNSYRSVRVELPMASDTSLYLFSARTDYADSRPENDLDSVEVLCARCSYPDLSHFSDSLTEIGFQQSHDFLARFKLKWHDNSGGQVEIAVSRIDGEILYRAEAASASGFNETQILLTHPTSLAGEEISIRLEYLDRTDRNHLDNVQKYVLNASGGPILGHFPPMPPVVELGDTLNTSLELASELNNTVDIALSVVVRNTGDSTLGKVLLAADSVAIGPSGHAGREYYVDLTVLDSLSGLRYGHYYFDEADMASTLGLPMGSAVNRSSFKVVKMTEPSAGASYPLHVDPVRDKSAVIGYRIQWGLQGARDSTPDSHRLYFSYRTGKTFEDVDYIGDDIYSLNNFGVLYHMRPFEGQLGSPAFIQQLGTPDSLRYMRLGIGDFNEDGHNDLIHSDKHHLILRLGQSEGGFGVPDTLVSVWRQTYNLVTAFGVAEPRIGDLNGDGHLDIAVSATGINNLNILRGLGNGSFIQESGSFGVMGGSGDIIRPDGFGKDILISYVGSGKFDPYDYHNRWFMISDGGSTYLYRGYGANDYVSIPYNGISAADFDNDGHEDVISDYLYVGWGGYGEARHDITTYRFEVPPTIAFWRGAGGGYFSPQLQTFDRNKFAGFVPSVSGWSEVGSMDNLDYNGDGHEDLIMTESSVPYRTMAYAGKGDFTFHPPEVLGYDSVSVWGMQVVYRRTVRTVAGLPGVNRTSGNLLSVEWSPSDLGPGEYALEAWLKRTPSDSERIGRSEIFRVLPGMQVVSAVEPAKLQYRAGEFFTGNLVLRNEDSMFPASEFTVKAFAVSAGDSLELLSRSDISIGALSTALLPIRFPAKADQSVVVLIGRFGAQDTASYSVPVHSNQGLVVGTLDLGSHEGISMLRAGRSYPLEMSASNVGNGADTSRYLLLLEDLAASAVDTLFDSTLSLAASSGFEAAISHPFDSAGSFRAAWLRAGAGDTTALDSRLLRVTGSMAPGIVKVSPPPGALVSAGTLVDIWVDTLVAMGEVSLVQNGLNRTALFRKDSLGYKLYRDTIPLQSVSKISISISAEDTAGNNEATGAGDANPYRFTYLYSDSIQPFIVTGVMDGGAYSGDLLVSIRADENLVKWPGILLNGAAWTGGSITEEGDYEILLTGVLRDNRSYERRIRFFIDKSGPVIEADNLANGDVFDYQMIPIIRAFDPHGVSLALFLDGVSWSPSMIGPGNHTLLAKAVDSLGNESTATFLFEVNATAGKFARINPPVSGSHHNRTVYPGIETNLDDVLEARIGIRNSGGFDSSAWSELRDSLGSAFLFDWISVPGRGESWSNPTDTAFYGFGRDGFYYSAGVKTDSLASWASEGASGFRGADTAFPESLLVASTDSGLYLFDSHSKRFWMKFKINFSGGNNHPIHRPLYNLQYQDGWLFGFSDTAFVIVSFAKDAILSWHKNVPYKYSLRWARVSNRNAGATPSQLYLGWYDWDQIKLRKMRDVKATSIRYGQHHAASLASSEGFFTWRFGSSSYEDVRAEVDWRDMANGVTNGMGYRFNPHPTGKDLVMYKQAPLNGYYDEGYVHVSSSSREYQYLAPDVHLSDIIKTFGHSNRAAPVRSLSFLSSGFLQTTYLNYIDSIASPEKRLIKVGKAPRVLLNETGVFNQDDWEVTRGLTHTRGGFIYPDSTAPLVDSLRLRIEEKREQVSNFTAELTVADSDPAKSNAYVRIALVDSSGASQATVYVKCYSQTSKWYTAHNYFHVRRQYVSAGHQVGNQTNRYWVLYGLDSGATNLYRLRMVRKNGNYTLHYWDTDKWRKAELSYGAVFKRPLRMQISMIADSGHASLGVRMDRYDESNTRYFPPEVDSLQDAEPHDDLILFRAKLKDGAARYYRYEQGSGEIQPLYHSIQETGGNKLLGLDPGRVLTLSDSQLVIRSSFPVDPVSPLDSVAEEGRHELIARVVSRNHGTFRDTSTFTIDRTPPAVQIDSVAPGQVYPNPVAIAYSISDAHLDTSRTEVTLNGFRHSGAPLTAHGHYTFRIKAIDSAGNVTDTSVAFALAPSLRQVGALTQLTLDEDTPDSSLSVSSLFVPGSGLAYAVLPAADLALGITSSGKLFLQPAPEFSGMRDVVLQATLASVSLYDTLRIVVRPVNDPPVLLSADSILGTGNQPVSYAIQFQDVDDAPAFEVGGLPAWLALSGQTLSGTAPLGGADTSIVITLSDGESVVACTVHVVIQNANQAPVIAPEVSPEPQFAGQALNLDLSGHAADPDPEHAASQLTWSWSTSASVTATPGANNHLWTLTPAVGFADTVTLRLTLTDPLGASAFQDVFLDWTLDNGPVKTYLKHWFPFREGAGTTASDSLSASSFALPSASLWSPDTGLAFQAAASPSLADTTVLDLRRGVSFEFWLKTDSLSQDTLDLLQFVHTAPGAAPAWAVRLDNKDLHLFQSGGTGGATAVFQDALVHENLWHHLVVSVSEDSVALYRNGALFGKLAQPAENPDSVEVVPTLGGSAVAGENPASIALLRVYERGFTSFKAAHNHGKAERQGYLAALVEAENFTARSGSYFPALPVAFLPSDTALGAQDTTVEDCMLMPADSSYLAFTVNISQGGLYSLVGRALGDIKDNSFWVQVDTTAPVSWHVSHQNQWKTEWVKGPVQPLPDQWYLSAGLHTLRIYTRELGTYLDWIGLADSDELVLPFVDNPAHFTLP